MHCRKSKRNVQRSLKSTDTQKINVTIDVERIILRTNVNSTIFNTQYSISLQYSLLLLLYEEDISVTMTTGSQL